VRELAGVKGRTTLGAAAALCLAVALSGCAAAPAPPPPPDPTDSEIDRIMVARVESMAASDTEAYPEVWSAITFGRFITHEEAPAVLGECMGAFGVTTVQIGTTGSMSWTDSAGDGFVETVISACQFAYPFDSSREFVHSDAQLEYLYNYVTTFLVPCLSAAGYASEKPPTRRAFMDMAHRDLWAWSPYNSIDFSRTPRWTLTIQDGPTEMEYSMLQNRCPYGPESELI